MKSKYKIFAVIIVGIIAVFTSYITLNFRWHLVLRDNKVILGFMPRVVRVNLVCVSN